MQQIVIAIGESEVLGESRKFIRKPIGQRKHEEYRLKDMNAFQSDPFLDEKTHDKYSDSSYNQRYHNKSHDVMNPQVIVVC